MESKIRYEEKGLMVQWHFQPQASSLRRGLPHGDPGWAWWSSSHHNCAGPQFSLAQPPSLLIGLREQGWNRDMKTTLAFADVLAGTC